MERMCAACEQTDDHPKDARVLQDGSEIPMHMDCCARYRNCEACQHQTRNQGELRGDEFRQLILTEAQED